MWVKNLFSRILYYLISFGTLSPSVPKNGTFHPASRWEKFQIASSHPNKISLFIIKNLFFYISYRLIKIFYKKILFSCYFLKNVIQAFFFLVLLDKSFASRLGIPVHPDRGKYFFGTLPYRLDLINIWGKIRI